MLEAVDGQRTTGQIANHASAHFGKLVSEDNVRTLISSQLLPLGLLRLADGSQPEVRKADPLLGMRFRYTVTDPERTRRLTAPFTVLFNPLIVVAVCAAFVAACWWVLMVKGLASATHDAFANPALVLLVLAVTVLSAGFHEFGHAAAARRGGATPGAMGAGLYLIWPAFFTDVTDSYRLGRGGRIRTDLGGLYFNAIVAVAVMGLWWATGFDALLLVVVTQILQMVRQLLPLVRFDGYHILADATGVPDLFQRIKPTLLGLLPWRRTDPAAQVLKPWARAVVTVWVLVTVPLLVFSLVMMVLSLPRLLGTAWASVLKQQAQLSESLAAGDIAGAAVRALAIAAVALPVLGIFYILLRLVRQLTTGLWQRTRGKNLQRGAAMAAVAAVTAGLAWAWWPGADTYRPVQPYERGTLADVTTAVFPTASYSVLREGQAGKTVALWPEGAAKPTREQPQLSMVLVPPPRYGTGHRQPAGHRPGRRRRCCRGAVVGVPLRPACCPGSGRKPGPRGEHGGRFGGVRRRFRAGVGGGRRNRGHHQRGLRLRQLHRLRRRGSGLPSGADRGPSGRDRAGEPLRGGELQLRPLPDVRAGQPAGAHPGRTAERGRHGKAQRAVGGDCGVRAEPAERPVVRDTGPTERVQGADHGDRPERPQRRQRHGNLRDADHDGHAVARVNAGVHSGIIVRTKPGSLAGGHAPAAVPSGTTTAVPAPAAPVTGGAAPETGPVEEAPATPEPAGVPTNSAQATPAPVPTAGGAERALCQRQTLPWVEGSRFSAPARPYRAPGQRAPGAAGVARC